MSEPTTNSSFASIWSDLAGVEFKQGYLDAGGYRTRFLNSGSSENPPLILLHGITGHAEAYVRNLASHGKHFNTWAIDFIGHGYSSKPSHPLEIKHYIEQLLAILDHLEIEKVSLSGESLGGWVTARFAQLYPDRVHKIALNTPGGTMANPEVMKTLYRLSMEAAKDPSWERVKARLEWLMADPSMVNDDLIATRQAIFKQSDWLQACEANMALQNIEIRHRNMLSDKDLSEISAETLVIWTTKDPSGPVEEGRRIADLIPNSIFAVINDAGHWPQYEQTEVFNDLHINFFTATQ